MYVLRQSAKMNSIFLTGVRSGRSGFVAKTF